MIRKGDRVQHNPTKKLGTADRDEFTDPYGQRVLIEWDNGNRAYIKAHNLRVVETDTLNIPEAGRLTLVTAVNDVARRAREALNAAS
jgi:hypothetical protein